MSPRKKKSTLAQVGSLFAYADKLHADFQGDWKIVAAVGCQQHHGLTVMVLLPMKELGPNERLPKDKSVGLDDAIECVIRSVNEIVTGMFMNKDADEAQMIVRIPYTPSPSPN